MAPDIFDPVDPVIDGLIIGRDNPVAAAQAGTGCRFTVEYAANERRNRRPVWFESDAGY